MDFELSSPSSIQSPALARAQVLERAQNFAGAETLLRTELLSKPHDANLRFALAYSLLRQNRPREALSQYTVAAVDQQPSPEDLGHVGQAYILLGDTADADRWTSLALRQQPRNADLWYSLGRIRYTEQRFAEAAACFRHTLALNPQSARAENNLGLAEEGLNQNDAAIADYRQSIAWFDAAQPPAKSPNSPPPATAAGHAAQQSTSGAEQPRLNLAIALLHRGELAEAAHLLESAVAISPEDAQIHEQIGKLAMQQGNTAAAVQALHEAVRLDPSNRGLRFLLGQALRRAGRPDEAQEQFAEAARLATLSAAAPGSSR